MDPLIFSYPKYSLNYWSIPKSASTSIKYALLQKEPFTNRHYAKDPKFHGDFLRWHRILHTLSNKEQISIEVEGALSNGFKNFTAVRHPYERFISMYKDFVFRRPKEDIAPSAFSIEEFPSIDIFIDAILEDHPEDLEETNPHIRSQSSYVCDANGKLFDIIITYLPDHTKKFLESQVITDSFSHQRKDNIVLKKWNVINTGEYPHYDIGQTSIKRLKIPDINLSEETKTKIFRRYEQDFDLFKFPKRFLRDWLILPKDLKKSN